MSDRLPTARRPGLSDRALPSSEERLVVAVDATPLIGQRTGIGQFTAGLLDALAAADGIAVRRYALTWRGRREAGADHVPIPARLAHGLWARSSWPPIELLLGRGRSSRRPSVVHGTNYVVPPTRMGSVVSVHDLTMIRFPGLCSPSTLRFPRLVRRAVERGALVHADSAYVAEEIRNWLPRADVRVVHPGIAHPAPEAPGGTDVARVGPGPYLLALGTIEPRKDYPTLIRAFAAIGQRTDLRLIIAGANGWGGAEFEEAMNSLPEAVRRRVEPVGYVSDPARDTLLRGAAALVYPSLYEGFGIAPLEAMARGVPVVATRAGSLPEVLGDAATLVPVRDVEALAGAIEAVLADPSPWRRRGPERASLYSWAACASQMAALYVEAAERAGRGPAPGIVATGER